MTTTISSMELTALLWACAPAVAPQTALALIAVESAGNPHAIGVVGGRLARQPRNLAEAEATVKALQAGGWNYSLGLGQINRSNFARYGLDPTSAFNPCENLRAMQGILSDCFVRASNKVVNRTQTNSTSSGAASKQPALRQALSCYYSGNFTTGFNEGYVARVMQAARIQKVSFSKTQEVSSEPAK